MDARDRFKLTLEHREPDRVPIDLGGIVTGISTGASAALKAHLGFYHSCGSIVPMIPLLIEGGVDGVHPLQPGAEGMGDRHRLKREHGADITFWGGFDQQDTLPFGTPEQVRRATRAVRRSRGVRPLLAGAPPR